MTITSASAPANDKSDDIPARSFAALAHRLHSSQPLAYSLAQLYQASPSLIRFYKARGVLDSVSHNKKNQRITYNIPVIDDVF